MTFTRTSPFLGGSTVIVSETSGCFAARATMALHMIGFPAVALMGISSIDLLFLGFGSNHHLKSLLCDGKIRLSMSCILHSAKSLVSFLGGRVILQFCQEHSPHSLTVSKFLNKFHLTVCVNDKKVSCWERLQYGKARGLINAHCFFVLRKKQKNKKQTQTPVC